MSFEGVGEKYSTNGKDAKGIGRLRLYEPYRKGKLTLRTSLADMDLWTMLYLTQELIIPRHAKVKVSYYITRSGRSFQSP